MGTPEAELDFLALHQAIAVSSPFIWSTVPPAARTVSATRAAVIAVPWQLFPAICGSRPTSFAAERLRPRSRMAHRLSISFQARCPFQFIVGRLDPLN